MVPKSAKNQSKINQKCDFIVDQIFDRFLIICCSILAPVWEPFGDCSERQTFIFENVVFVFLPNDNKEKNSMNGITENNQNL